jgi:hypothetical protein
MLREWPEQWVNLSEWCIQPVGYMAPELNRRGRLVCHLMNVFDGDDDRLVARFLNINDQAISHPETISIFNRNGRIE